MSKQWLKYPWEEDKIKYKRWHRATQGTIEAYKEGEYWFRKTVEAGPFKTLEEAKEFAVDLLEAVIEIKDKFKG